MPPVGGSSGSAALVLRNVPSLVVARRSRRSASSYDPRREYVLRYRAKRHRDLPHVVKFSGGRSSGMLLFTLLTNGLLNPDRGDAIVFNNTASEHPDTYRFARNCREAAKQYQIPFFWVEFQTYEDVRDGEWTRLPTYRLVNDQPRSSDNADGFHWRGEVFEELLSWSGYVPNQFTRICTQRMKLEATRMFLKDWLAGKDRIPRLGHHGKSSRIGADTLYRRHLRNRGSVPRDVLLRKRSYALARPHYRPEQRYGDFSPVWQLFESPGQRGVFGDKAYFGPDGVEYLAFVGLRGDETARVKRVEDRNSGPASSGYEGEHVYMPLADMCVGRADVNTFWDFQEWGLCLPGEGGLSNCVYCFLKGFANLQRVHTRMESRKEDDVPGFGSLVNTPSDIAWWQRMERTYGRDLREERREIRGNPTNDFVGFFGASSGFSYDKLAESEESDLSEFSNTVLPCECTE